MKKNLCVAIMALSLVCATNMSAANYLAGLLNPNGPNNINSLIAKGAGSLNTIVTTGAQSAAGLAAVGGAVAGQGIGAAVQTQQALNAAKAQALGAAKQGLVAGVAAGTVPTAQNGSDTTGVVGVTTTGEATQDDAQSQASVDDNQNAEADAAAKAAADAEAAAVAAQNDIVVNAALSDANAAIEAQDTQLRTDASAALGLTAEDMSDEQQ